MKRDLLVRLIGLLAVLVLLVACGDDSTEGQDTDGDSPDDGVFDCEGDVCYLTGTILEDVTLTPDINWVLRGGVFIGDDESETVLTIEPGTTIYGETSTNGMLVIRRGSKIMAEGTREAPIVFTSSKEAGDRARGDWGGIIINGRAPINGCEDGEFCESFGEGGTGYYGGDKPNDNSGVLRYVRVEFAGRILSPDNELNGIAFQGVGSGTTAEYIQVHMNKDDAVEFFGGTATIKYVLVTGMADDAFDWTDGWVGKAQFVVIQQHEDAGDNGIEADNNAENNDSLPRSKPTLANFTIIGSPDSEFSDIGMLLREGTAGNLYNMLVVGFNEACLDINHAATFTQAGTPESPGPGLTIQSSILSCQTNFKVNNEKDKDDNAIEDPWSLEAWFLAQTGNQVADPKLGKPYDIENPDYAPKAGSPALSGATFPEDNFFDKVDFIGAIDPANDWTQGWTTHAKN